ncbi:MAG: DUF1501 domain-containing protein [Ferruginibacter sp.]|nr:DUF1501 domain-containing protein [Ferruginibacter sp.]
MIIKRKDFLQIGSLATASLMMPKFLKALEKPTKIPVGNKVVVVIQLSGGNDGLNTVIPITNDIYYKERATISINKNEALGITDVVALHPSLTAFKDLYASGNLSIMNSVGYPNPDRSHFRSMDIWQSASESNEYVNTGWLGRYLDAQCKNCEKPTYALELDDTLSLALKGKENKGLAFNDPRKLYNTSKEKFYADINATHIKSEENVDYLYKTMSETISSANYIFQKSKLNPTNTSYPNTALGKDLKTIASLILSDINTKVYYVSLGSFDTHAGQLNQQKRLFDELNEAIKSFTNDMKMNNRFEDVLLMTFSEFGRRVSQNASNGTDHGTANNMFFISGGLKEKGVLNALPNLMDLNNGDLKYNVDFRNVYATVLNKWLGVNDKEILGSNFERYNFLG